MTPYYTDDWLTVWQGDCREVMAQMPEQSVHTVVTSPPYWGLRDYGIGGQLGLEPTPEEYVTNMVAVFREVRRVLRADGTCWVNLGDSYIAHAGSGQARGDSTFTPKRGAYEASDKTVGGKEWRGLPGKNLVGIPWRVAFALQADGWYLRSDIIWSKPNPMPESVTDRPTKAHEYLFLLSKSPRYYYDADAVREAAEYGRREWTDTAGNMATVGLGGVKGNGTVRGSDPGSGRNLRSVWSIATQPYPGAHFATFPEKLVEPCVKAGTSERGVCPECGAPWRRTTDVEYTKSPVHGSGSVIGRHEETGANGWDGAGMPRLNKNVTTTGWVATCPHAGGGISDLILGPPPAPAVVLDPFAGSGTTGRVAQRLGRRAVLIDLSGEYLVQAMKRNHEIPLGLEAG